MIPSVHRGAKRLLVAQGVSDMHTPITLARM